MNTENGMSGRYWIGTIPALEFTHPSPLPAELAYVRGQREIGHGESEYEHYQLVAVFNRTVRLSAVRKFFPGHWELTRSTAALAYVWKDDTRVPDSQFEIGALPLKRNSKTDWESVKKQAQEGDLSSIPPDIYIRCYNQLRRISSDHQRPVAIERTCEVFWGRTETGKSRRAWTEAGLEAYPKDPQTKWWCGYQGEQHVVIDEFRGAISISHLLRWLDRYPVRVECKGSTHPLNASKIWITSNLDPRKWYPELDEQTLSALLRRLNITHFLYLLCPNASLLRIFIRRLSASAQT